MNGKELKNLIEKSETQEIEFKESLKLEDEIGKEVSAFSNTRIIKECLEHSLPEPLFELITENLVVTFRKYRISEEDMEKLSKEEKIIVKFIQENGKISRKECVKLLNISPTTAFIYFKSLEKKKIIEMEGRGKNIYYTLI